MPRQSKPKTLQIQVGDELFHQLQVARVERCVNLTQLVRQFLVGWLAGGVPATFASAPVVAASAANLPTQAISRSEALRRGIFDVSAFPTHPEVLAKAANAKARGNGVVGE
jgi:hypothetical protein